ncbi:MAG: GNAT family N-acetyltransferase [Myxococcota bacterium]
MGAPATPFHIRLARPGEAERVHRLMADAFEEYRAQPHPSSALGEDVEAVRRAMEGGGAILAFEGDEPVGSGRFIWKRREDGRLALAFERLAVPPAHRGRGIGAAMIEWLEAHARDGGADVVEVTVRSQQPDNRPYYLRRGYRITGYSARYGIPDIRTHMEKDCSA